MPMAGSRCGGMNMTTLRALLSTLLAVACCAAPAQAALTMLNVGKFAHLVNTGNPATNGGQFVVRHDRALQPVLSPACPAGSAVEVEAYLQSTYRDAVLAKVTLDCAKWRRTNKRRSAICNGRPPAIATTGGRASCSA